MIGDTDSTGALLQDEEIAFFLTQNTDPTGAAVLAARSIAAKFARLADRSVESVRVAYSQKADGYWKLADKLQAVIDKAATSTALPSATGVSIAAMDAAKAETDRPADSFSQGMFTNNG